LSESRGIVKCRNCGALKIKYKNCPVCKKFKVERIIKICKSRNAPKTLRIIEENIISPKKNDTRVRYSEIRHIKIASARNKRGDFADILMPLDNPNLLIFCHRGGIHNINIPYTPQELLEIVKRWRRTYEDYFGVRPYLRGPKSRKRILEGIKRRRERVWLKRF